MRRACSSSSYCISAQGRHGSYSGCCRPCPCVLVTTVPHVCTTWTVGKILSSQPSEAIITIKLITIIIIFPFQKWKTKGSKRLNDSAKEFCPGCGRAGHSLILGLLSCSRTAGGIISLVFHICARHPILQSNILVNSMEEREVQGQCPPKN